MTVASHPDFPDWTIYGIAHNWGNACELETSFQTALTSSSDSVREERRILLGHPTRTLTLNWRGITRERLNKILVSMRNMSSGYWVVPIYPDQSELTVDYSSGTSLYCSTLLRRFFVGSRILVLGEDSHEWAEVAAVHDDRLVLTEELEEIHQVGLTLVLPCIDVEPLLSPEINMVTGRVGNLSLTAQEIVGPNTLPGFDGVPTGFSTFLGLPILYLEHNWIDTLTLGYVQEGSLDPLGRGRVYHLRGDHPRVTMDLSLLLERADAMSLVHFFEGRKGRALPFWMADPEDLWEILEKDANGINIEPIGDFSDFEDLLEYIGIRDEDGDVYVRKVLSLTNYTTYWRISTTTTLPDVTISSVARARISRFDSDAMTEEWVTSEVMRTKIKVIELLDCAEEL